MNARNEESLRTLADSVLPLMKGKVHALNQCLSDAQAGNIRASDKVVKFWTSKKEAAQMLLEVYENAKVPSTALDASAQARREEYFKVAKASWEVALVHVLTKLNEKIIGPYTLGELGRFEKKNLNVHCDLARYHVGEQYSIADPHLTAWFARVVMLAGGSSSDNGNVVIEKLEKHIGSSLVLPNIVSGDAPRTDAERSSARTKLGIYWDTVKERSSWKKVYGHGLH